MGSIGDLPAPADYDGDGKADLAVFTPLTGIWKVRRSSDSTLQSIQFGTSGDRPIAGDYDGDGRADFAVYRDGTGGGQSTWYALGSSSGALTSLVFGLDNDRAVPAD